MTPVTPAAERRDNDMRIQSIEALIKDGFARMETQLSGLDTRLRNVENCQAGQVAAQAIKIGNLETQVKELENKVQELEEKRIKELEEKRIKPLEEFREIARPWIAAVKWLAITVGGLVVSLLWAMLIK